MQTPPPSLARLLSRTAPEVIDGLVAAAVDAGASDVHLEPRSDGGAAALVARFRVDGVLREVVQLPPRLAEPVVSRIKVLAALDVAERRRPQDGRIRTHHGPERRPIDLRVSVLPVQRGEKVVLRVLDRSAVELDLASLGLAGRDLRAFREAVRAPHGVVLVTGPTGSGKTTTLYAALREVTTTERGAGLNVTTAEDPVEYDLPGVNQVQVRPEIGFGFAEALRAFLRQDPDVILVGEIRDGETADVAVRAALTGHLVLSTLHTNDAASAPARLVDMGVPPYLLAATVRTVVAQRLVRRLCSACRRPLVPGTDAYASALRALDVREGTPALEKAVPIHSGGDTPGAPCEPVGCEACAGTGYRGRVGLFEVLVVDESTASLISRGAPVSEIRSAATRSGMVALREAAVRLALSGNTSAEEALRVVG